MSNTVFLAGAGGVIGRRLVSLLRRRGLEVLATTRSPERKAGARRLIAQSIAWGYQQGPEPHGEADPIDPNVHGVATRALTWDHRFRSPG